MKEPLVSIVCLVYNHEPYLRDCLEGFLMQKTDFPIEILIHDDASADGSSAIIREYSDKYPDKFIPILQAENQYSKGTHIWAEILFPRAKGKYIALCEGDDYWIDPYKLQKEVDIMEKDSSLMGVFTNNMIVDKDGKCLLEKSSHFYPGNKEGRYSLHDFFQNAPSYPTASVVFRNSHGAEVHDKLIHTNNNYMGDWTLWAILHSYGDFYYLDEVTIAYRINPTSLTHTMNRVGRAKANFTICQSLKEVLPEEYGCYLKKGGWMYFSVANAYRKEKKYVPMAAYFFWCLVRYPRFTVNKVLTMVNKSK